MSEFVRPLSKEEFEENFSQIKPIMNDTEAYLESSRCLFCYDAPCVTACPSGIDIPLFIRQINTKNITGAAKTIYEANYLGNTCGKVCPTEVLCEGACVFNHQNVKPLEIGRLQSFSTTNAIERGVELCYVREDKNKKVAIIGAGPSGISCACELRKEGFEVDIYEAKSQPSGLALHGVAPYKITNKEVLTEMNYLKNQFGYKVLYNTPIDSKDKITALEAKYDAIFIGVGLGKSKSISIKGETNINVYGAVEFIEKLKLQHQEVFLGKKAIVLGGGNTAMDAASECARMGVGSVVLAYRGSEKYMSAYAFEYDLAKAVGVKGLFNTLPVEILEEKGKLVGVRFINTAYENGELVAISGTEFIEECDMVIMATGQSKKVDFLAWIDHLSLDKESRIEVNEKFQTTNKKYFAAGDAVNGGAEVVNAVSDAKRAAQEIKVYLSK
ncbi:MAG: FAD-dependent oxidoreductase [Cyclobacteriaceae bacterium]|nr:FAD-dependent oxidoreductase [Cyclobacteriaceae bacterium]